MINIVDGVKKYAKTDRLAVIEREDILSYKDLDKFSDIIANYIIRNSKTVNPVAIYANKDIMILPVMIGALKSGRAYVPMDVSFPQQRVDDVVEAVCPDMVFDFTDGEYFFNKENREDKKENYKNVQIISRQDLCEIVEENKNTELAKEVPNDQWVKGDENSYILFTSGSTGKPKGVQISTYNLNSFIEWMSPILGIDGSEKVVMDQPAYSFDLSVSQLYPGIANGATLYSLSKKVVADFNLMFEEMKKSNMDVWVSTPTFIGMCLSDDSFTEELLPNLRKLLFIGEVLPVETARKLRERFPKAEVINGYGPTEATVGISHVIISDEHINSGQSLPVGVPMPNSKIKIVDEQGKEVPKGEKGEIIIIGPSVSKGYYKNEAKNLEAFYVEEIDPWTEIDAEYKKELDKRSDEDKEFDNLRYRAYRTGDLGSILEDGNIKYSGRKDFQIKLNGYRIEIEDIENNLRKVTNVKNAVVLPVYKNEKIAFLKAIVELKKSNDLGNLKNGIKIKKELSNFMPEYMIPRSVAIIDSMPTNTNGKIDRKKLKEEYL
ncbi:D-alanine--poly(phosphoribitol) ligase subunit DltA [Peptostreptococcus equinus]|uniref:D-alanine--poly(phosphoribitol) ligase subunit DltA n=1 Tax=Peptostreptococcus equinus TaxID=3003601 RepID=UPI002F2B6530